jgi:hypothetical protein
MAIDAIAMANKLDTVILATGDGDFVPLVEYLRYTSGMPGRSNSFGKSSAGSLREAADDFIDMCDDPKNYLIGYRGGKGGWIPGFLFAKPSPKKRSGYEEDPAIELSGETRNFDVGRGKIKGFATIRGLITPLG